MPNRDGTGPEGKGARTGRGLGPCGTGAKSSNTGQQRTLRGRGLGRQHRGGRNRTA